MIHLDANYLIGATRRSTPIKERLGAWLQDGESLATSSIAWAEFLNGPLNREEIQIAEMIVEERIVNFGQLEAQLAAQLFNRAGCRRGSQPDCFIAATAICAKASLATENRRDFQPFVAAGLRLL